MNSYDINLNNADCIKEREEIGYTEYFNICTNQTSRVDWGIGKSILLTFICFLIITAIVVMITVLIELWR